MTWADLIPYSGLIAILIVVEFIFSAKLKWSNYDLKEVFSTLGVKYLRIFATLLYGILFGPLFAWAYEHRLFTINLDPVPYYILAILLAEFTFYWCHRFAHENALGWASHATHHTLKKLNLTNGGRVEITSPFSLYYFAALPVFWLGVDPNVFANHINTILLFQLVIHTEVVPKIPWIDWFLNTPSNHRAHHGLQDVYRNKNFGGTIVVFDHLFGTYQAEIESEKPKFGLSTGVPSQNPFRLAFIGWEMLLRSWLQKRRRSA